MKNGIVLLLALFLCTYLNAQNTNIEQATSIRSDGAQPDSSAMLDVQSTSKGVLIPRMTTAQREAIASPADGLLVYDAQTGSYWYFENGLWKEIAIRMIASAEGSSAAGTAIPDDDPNGIKDTIVLNDAGILDSSMRITVCLDITHSYVADLDIMLIAPNGSSIELSSDIGSSGDNYTNSCFSAHATSSIATATPPFTGTWLPEQSFSLLYGSPLAGNWILMVSDDFQEDTGTLNWWTIEISRGEPAPSTLADKDGDTRIQVEKHPDEDRIRFVQGGAQRMIIDTTGKVGIGATQPDRTLSVSASVANDGLATFNNADSNGFAGVYFDSEDTTRGYIGYVGSGAWCQKNTFQVGTFGQNNLHFLVGDCATPRLMIQAATGNIGLGLGDPQEQLHLTGNLRLDSADIKSETAIRLMPDVDTTGDQQVRIYDNQGQEQFSFEYNAGGNPVIKQAGNNTIIGNSAVGDYINGIYNVVIGGNAAASPDTGNHNTYIGAFAGQYSGGIQGVFLGSNSGRYNEGSRNTFLGVAAGFQNTSGFGNVMVGEFTGSINKTGYALTLVGDDANVLDSALYNATALGANTVVNASNKVRIGDGAVSVIEGQVDWSFPSDGRFKYDVEEDIKGLDFITRLRPVSYRFDAAKYDEHIRPPEGLTNRDREGIPQVQLSNPSNQSNQSNPSNPIYSGFIAQEVEQAIAESGFEDFSGLVKPSNPKDNYGLRYGSFVVPLVKAVQEQQGMIEEQRQQLESQQALIESQQSGLSTQEERIAELERMVQKLVAAMDER